MFDQRGFIPVQCTSVRSGKSRCWSRQSPYVCCDQNVSDTDSIIFALTVWYVTVLRLIHLNHCLCTISTVLHMYMVLILVMHLSVYTVGMMEQIKCELKF